MTGGNTVRETAEHSGASGVGASRAATDGQYQKRFAPASLFANGYTRDGAYYRCERDNRRTVALFSHGGSSVAMMARLLNVPFPYLCQTMHIHFTGITILRFDSRAGSTQLPVLELVNDGRHIKDMPSKLP